MCNGDYVGKTDLSIVVCDAGPVIHLDQLNSLDLLEDLGQIIIPEEVWHEVLRHRSKIETQQPHFIKHTKILKPQNDYLPSFIQIFNLDSGEQQALQIINELKASLFLTDDAAARLAALQLGLEVHGTIGILVRAIRRKLRTPEEVISLLKSIPTHSTLYIQRTLLEKVINTIEAEIKLSPRLN